MQLKDIRQADVKGKKVLVRVDFNVELDLNGDVTEEYKLTVAKQTIDYLAGHGAAKIALVTHFGRPKGKDDKQFSVGFIVDDAERALGRHVSFVDDCIGPKVEDALSGLMSGSVLILENTRFYSEEEGNDAKFAEEMARPFDMFVNEAFSACHRAHASVVGVTQYLPSFAGFRVLEEVEHLEKVGKNPEHPAVAVVGGAKAETKIPLIKALEKTYDAILVGGKVANEILDAGTVFPNTVFLPGDFRGEERFDIGPATTARYVEIIGEAKTIVWNGPMGKFEDETYSQGTNAVVHAILENKEALRVAGGGESLVLLEQAGAMDRIGFVSTGGGAMLEFLSGEPMPGLEALRVQ